MTAFTFVTPGLHKLLSIKIMFNSCYLKNLTLVNYQKLVYMRQETFFLCFYTLITFHQLSQVLAIALAPCYSFIFFFQFCLTKKKSPKFKNGRIMIFKKYVHVNIFFQQKFLQMISKRTFQFLRKLEKVKFFNVKTGNTSS